MEHAPGDRPAEGPDTGHGTPGHDVLGHDTPGHDVLGGGTPGHDVLGGGTPGHDTPGHGTVGHGTVGHDTPQQGHLDTPPSAPSDRYPDNSPGHPGTLPDQVPPGTELYRLAEGGLAGHLVGSPYGRPTDGAGDPRGAPEGGLPGADPSPVRFEGNSPVRAGLVLTVVFAVVLGTALIGEVAGPRLVAGSALADPAATAAGRGPAARSAPRAVFTLGDNPLLGEEVQATGADCELPSFGRTDERLTTYYLALVGCLNDVWGSVLRAANIPFRPPVLRVTADLPDSSCGRAPNDETVAYYCGRDETIYMSTKRGLADGGGTRAPSHLATLSHEYGHHVQLLSGMLAAASRRIEDAGERSPSGLELTRRVELQANCLAGVFLFAAGGHGSLSTSLARQANQDFHNAVVEPAAENSHGSPSHQGWWADSGFGSGRPSACNTWNAPPDEVS